MNKVIYTIFIMLLSISVVAALPVTTDPSSIVKDVIKGQNAEIIIQVTNPNIYNLYDVTATGDFVSSSTISTLDANSTKALTLTVNIPELGDVTRNILIKGFSKVNCSSFGAVEELIEITPSSGANPRNLELCVGSNIRFFNNYSYPVKLIIDSFSINNDLANGDSHVQNYPSVGSFVYIVEYIDQGTITVVDSAQKVHNEEDDLTITMQLTSRLISTNLSININTIIFNMSHDQTSNWFSFIIKNTGSVKAENVLFSGDWLSFDKNNLDINPGAERAVEFFILPEITDILQTGKTHVKQIVIRGSNIDEIRKNLTIFIKQSDVLAGNISSPEWWIKRKAFCDAFPVAPDCLTEPLIIFRDKEIFDCPAILANVSPKHVTESLQECNKLRGDFSTFSNNFKLDVLEIKDSNLEQEESNLNFSKVLSFNTETLEGFRDTFYFVVSLIVMGVVFTFVGIVAFRYYKKQKYKKVGKYV